MTERAGSEPDEYLIERIRTAIAQDSMLGELDVHVQVAGGRIFLTGTVATPERHARISTVVEELCPDCEVRNDISVSMLDDATGTESIG